MIRDEKISKPRIDLLDSKISKEVYSLIEKAEKELPSNVTIRITQGLRTIKEQNELYAQGRTKSGKIVTHAKGGQSWHNYGLAFDFVLIIDGKVSWNIDKNWKLVAKVFKDAGYVWGGDWKFKDYPHFEKTFGKTLKEMK